jgi:hypothetical protein
VRLVGAVLALLLASAAPAAADDDGATAAGRAGTTAVVLPPVNADWDYQLGGAVAPADNVGVVTRDRTARPASGRYDICYVNAFQTQDSERSFWRDHPSRWRLVLKRHGTAVVDAGWGEWLLDTRTSARRTALAGIVGRWIDGCAADGFDAVEFDNLDSFLRSKGLVTRADNRAFARTIVARAHRAGLAAGQKNWVELGAAGPGLGFDFAVAEQCGQYRECAGYVATYGSHVLAVEYTDRAFAWTCAHFGDRLAVVRRDLDLTAHGVRRYC